MKIRATPHGTEFWYDRHTRCWWARRIDPEGNQIGDAEHAYTRGEIDKIVADFDRSAQ